MSDSVEQVKTPSKDMPPQLAIGLFMTEVAGKPHMELKVNKNLSPLNAIKLLQETVMSLLSKLEEQPQNRIAKPQPNFLQTLRSNMGGNGRVK